MKYFILILKLILIDGKKKAFLPVIFMLLTGILDALGVISVLPFMALLTNPEIIEQNKYIKIIYESLNFENNKDFIFFAGIFVLCILLLSIIIRSISIYLQLKFALMKESSISTKILEHYMSKSYEWFVSQHSANMSRILVSEVGLTVHNSLVPAIQIFAQIIIVTCILLVLFIANPLVAGLIGFLFTFIFILIAKITKSPLKRFSKKRIKANENRFKAITEAFSSIKELKFRRNEYLYINRFKEAANTYAVNLTKAMTTAYIPRYSVEAIVFSGTIISLLIIVSSNKNFVDTMPIISAYVFAGYRLIPSLQLIYTSYAQIKFAEKSVNLVISSFDEALNSNKHEQNKSDYNKIIEYQKDIKLNNICFHYNNNMNTIQNLSICISKGEKIGLIGSSGSGKTTLVDIILGLLKPKSGKILVDNVNLDSTNIKAWIEKIGYVDQNVILIDDTIASNVAFGLDKKNIDLSRVIEVCKIVQIDDFITNSLTNGYDTFVGERGSKLSGGQKQRIGLARALYSNPDILVLDEATSALDNKTEKIVIESLERLDKNLTIIMIAHRLSTLKNCDKIYHLENGIIAKEGNYLEVINNYTSDVDIE
jgi:ABC-type multidrug transport system fused ATPase/permease subunit